MLRIVKIVAIKLNIRVSLWHRCHFLSKIELIQDDQGTDAIVMRGPLPLLMLVVSAGEAGGGEPRDADA
eukprot:15353345-Ditylum_brightwellii.AAC.1